MRTNESGFTLIGVLAVFTIISVFGISLVMLSISSVKTSNTEHDDQSVFYVAEAGTNYMVNEIEQQVNDIYDSSQFRNPDKEYYKEFEPSERGNPEAEIHVEHVSDSNPVEYKITSIGTIGDQSRTVERTIAIDWPSGGDESGGNQLLPAFAMFTYGKDIHLKENIHIIGNIGTAASGNNDVKIDKEVNLDKIDAIFLPKSDNDVIKYEGNFNEDKNSGKIVIMNDIPTFPALPGFPQLNQVEVNQDTEYRNGKLENKSMNIDTNNQDLKIRMDSLSMQNSSINIIGSGIVTIFIDNKIDLMKGSTINLNGKTDQLNIYSKGKIDLMEKSILNGSIYIEDGDLDLKFSSELYGNIFIKKGKLDITKNSTVHSEIILAPYSMVKLDNANIKGPIIADKFQMHSGSLDHRPPFTLTGPLSFESLGYEWPDLGQGNAENGDNSNDNLPKPEDSPTITVSPIKEVPNY